MRLDHSEIEMFGQHRADITALADRRWHLPGAGLATSASLRKTASQSTGHPVDVGLVSD